MEVRTFFKISICIYILLFKNPENTFIFRRQAYLGKEENEEKGSYAIFPVRDIFIDRERPNKRNNRYVFPIFHSLPFF